MQIRTKLKHKVIQLPPLPVDVYYYQGNITAWEKLAKRLYCYQREDEYVPKGCCLNLKNGCQVIWTQSRNYVSIAHEAVHATENILNLLRYKEFGEFGAYLVDYILEECMEVGQ